MKADSQKGGYEILQFTLCEGWVNNLFDGDDKSYVFDKLEEAIAEIQEEFDDWQAEIKSGARGTDEGYDICLFRIRCNSTGVDYELDLIDGVILVSQGLSYH